MFLGFLLTKNRLLLCFSVLEIKIFRVFDTVRPLSVTVCGILLYINLRSSGNLLDHCSGRGDDVVSTLLNVHLTLFRVL